tara:strand:+ start:740 stop:958 length:219 start_codon:yes stop_codon:yes gene_type:complete
MDPACTDKILQAMKTEKNENGELKYLGCFNVDPADPNHPKTAPLPENMKTKILTADLKYCADAVHEKRSSLC